MHGYRPYPGAAKGPVVPQGFRRTPSVRPHGEGDRREFRDRREERLLLPPPPGAQGVHPAPAPLPAEDRVPRRDLAPLPRTRSRPGPGPRRLSPGGGRRGRGGALSRSRFAGGWGDLLPAREG